MLGVRLGVRLGLGLGVRVRVRVRVSFSGFINILCIDRLISHIVFHSHLYIYL